MTPSRKKLAAGVLVLVVLLVGGLGFRQWTRSPAYSLRALVHAVENRDRYEFEKYVDVDSLLQAFASDTVEDNPLAAAMSGGIVSSLKPQVLKVIEDGSVPTDSQFGRAFHKLMSEPISTDVQGRSAYFTVPISTKGGAPFSLKVHMTQVPDGYWRIDRIANLKELRKLEAEEEKLRKQALAKEIADKLKKLEVVARLHTSVGEGWARKNRFQVKLKNAGDKVIIGFSGAIRLPAQDFSEPIRGEVRLAPGETTGGAWEFRVNQFVASTERVFALGETENFDVEIESLTYEGGTKIEQPSDE